MARVAQDHDVPQIAVPVGSREEVEALGVSTRNIATCSKRTDRDNFGCPMRDRCDREHRDTRPHNEIVETIGTTGDVRVGVCACFVTVRAEVDSEDKGTLVRVIGHEGDTFKYRGSRKLHVTRDPNCNECMQGKCEKYVDDEFESVCEQFPAAATHPELRKFARRREARIGGSVSRRAAIERKLLGGADDESAPEKKGDRGARA